MKKNILFYDMGTYTQRDMAEKFQNMGIGYRNVVYKLKNLYHDTYFEKCIGELLQREHYDAVFSINYFPVLSGICMQYDIPYLSWSYDAPLNIEKIEETLGNPVNYVFFFDRAECQKYWDKGYTNIYHLPLAVNTERLDRIIITQENRKQFQTEVSMVGQLYETFLPVLMQPLSDYDKGYLSAILETQMRLYGCYFLDEVVTEELIQRMNQEYARLGQDRLLLNRDGLIVSMAKHITHMERILLLDILSEEWKVNLYGPGTDEVLTKVQWRGSAGYFDSMPIIFKMSKINLNISLKCITSGIPLRALDIMGCGGFLLTNYQPEIAEHFADGEEVVMYTSLCDAVEKCRYYMEHEEERLEIARKGYEKVKQMFRYEDRINTMLRTTGLE